MSVKIEIFDGATPLLDEIAKIHFGQAKDALDYSGAILRDAIRSTLRESEPSKYHVVVVKGKRVWRRGGKTRFGDRFNFKKAGPESMANMVNSFPMFDNPNHTVVVVGGMNKNKTVNRWRDGKVVGTEKVPQVLGGTYEILKKLNNGGSFQSQSKRYKATRMGEDTKPMGKNPMYKGRFFIERGRDKAMPEVTKAMTTRLESMIHRQVNRVSVKMTVRTSA